MRVLFLTLYPDCVASPRYRVGQFLPYLREHGVECTVAGAMSTQEYQGLTGPNRPKRAWRYHWTETKNRLRQLVAARAYDVVFVQKAITTAYLRGACALLRARARSLVYDIDDAVHLRPPHPLRRLARMVEDPGQVKKIMAAARLVLAGNPWLKEAAEAAGAGRAVWFPTVVDTDRFVPAAAAPGAYRVGWIGNPSTTDHLAPAAEALAALEQAEIVLVGADEARVPWTSAATSIRAWALDREVAEIQGYSVGIMPLPKDTWARGKCALKALQYMACGVPCVATPYGAVLEVITHGENGLFADSPAEWRDALERLRDPALRRRLGQAARATVEERFALRVAAPRLRALLEELV